MLASISVVRPELEHKPFRSDSSWEGRGATARCYLLELPAELRDAIWKLALPTTVRWNDTNVDWVHGNTSILATNKRIYNEAIGILYGSNTFAINVIWERATFAYMCILSDNLTSMRNLTFPKHLTARNIALIRHLVIRVHHSARLPWGQNNPTRRLEYQVDQLKHRVEQLCQHLADIPDITRLHVHIQKDNPYPELSIALFRPFLALTNIHGLTVSVFPVGESEPI